MRQGWFSAGCGESRACRTSYLCRADRVPIRRAYDKSVFQCLLGSAASKHRPGVAYGVRYRGENLNVCQIYKRPQHGQRTLQGWIKTYGCTSATRDAQSKSLSESRVQTAQVAPPNVLIAVDPDNVTYKHSIPGGKDCLDSVQVRHWLPETHFTVLYWSERVAVATRAAHGDKDP